LKGFAKKRKKREKSASGDIYNAESLKIALIQWSFNRNQTQHDEENVSRLYIFVKTEQD
jgi:hypothetical protein